jgi:hypothetical protein
MCLGLRRGLRPRRGGAWRRFLSLIVRIMGLLLFWGRVPLRRGLRIRR